MIIFITGASRGLGLEFTRQYLEAGHTVAAAARNPETAGLLRELAQSFPEHCLLVPLEVTDESSRLGAAKRFGEWRSSLDLLINNAGIARWEKLADLQESALAETFQVNAFAPLFVTRALLPLLEKGVNPTIINISSLLGSITHASDGDWANYAYNASKAALNMLTRQLAFELRPSAITVIAQHPGWVKTDLGGQEAPLLPADAVARVRRSIAGYSFSQSGGFFDPDGHALPY